MIFVLANDLFGSVMGILFLGVGVMIVVSGGLLTAASEVKAAPDSDSKVGRKAAAPPRAIDRLAKD